MLGLKLRDEFLGTHMPGTAISLRTSDNRGAAQKSPDHILSITYPTADVQTALKAISFKNNGRPIVLMGDRGRGKSHIMAVMHHAIQSPGIVEKWLKDWKARQGNDDFKIFEMVKGYIPISEPVHNHEYPLLWDLLFDRHPKGQYYKGQFESMAQPFPPRTLLEKMFEDQPTCLILDEFQTWYGGLPDKDPKTGLLLKKYAFNFVQIFSEIATDRSEILIFVISVLNNQNDAFQQVHRKNPVIIDFRGPSAKQDRQKLVLHRLFENRRNIPEADIKIAAEAYASERFRLLHAHKSVAEKERVLREVFVCWPFSPELLDLIEDHILLSSAAQETRDLIRILAQVFRSRGDSVPVISPADFFIDGDSDEVQTLVDSIAVQAGQEKLRQVARRNLEAVRDSGVNVPNARELVSAIWMRSMSPGKNVGGTPLALHLDITRGGVIDDNAFQAELALLIENSVNIHGDEIPGGSLWFGLNENPRSKVRSCAKNDKLWHPGALPTAGLTVYPGKDISHLRNTLRHIFVPETSQPLSRIIILGPNWKNDPWGEVDEADTPARWDRPVLLVVPDQIEGGQAGLNETMGHWLVKHVQKRRNTIRFLLPAADAPSLFSDDELIYSARCSFLCSREGWGSDATYRALHQDFDRPLRASLRSRFNRFAVIRRYEKRMVFLRVIELRGKSLPDTVTLADGTMIETGHGTVPRRANFTCASCGREANTLESVRSTGHTGPVGAYTLQCHCPECETEGYTYGGRYFKALGAFQQYLRNQNMFCFWDIGYDKLAPMMSNANYHPKALSIENCVFHKRGRGNVESNQDTIISGLEWANNPWDGVLLPGFEKVKSQRIDLGDPLIPGNEPYCGSSTDLSNSIPGTTGKFLREMVRCWM